MSDRPLRILHLTLGADGGGLSQYIIQLGNAMVELGHEVTVAGDTGAWVMMLALSGVALFALRRVLRPRESVPSGQPAPSRL